MSTVLAAVRSSAARQRSAVSRVIISAVRSGPASTWQCRQVMLQSLPTLIWKISIDAGRSVPAASAKLRSGSRASVCTCSRVEASGEPRETSEVVARGPLSFSVSAAPTLCHHLLVHMLEHLHAVHERCAAADRGGHVQRLGHRLESGPLLQRLLRVGLEELGPLTTCATASAMSAFSRAESAPGLNTSPYQAKNSSASFGLPSAMLGNCGRCSGL